MLKVCLHVKTCSHLASAFASTSKFNIVSIALQMLTLENGFRPILCVYICVTIDAMLNFDFDLDANADVTCKQSITFLAHVRYYHRY